MTRADRTPFSGGNAIATAVNSGGVEVIPPGAKAGGTTAGTPLDTSASSGTSEIVSSGQTITGAVIHAGETETIWNGGTTIGTVLTGTYAVLSGPTDAYEIVSSGGTSISAAVNSAGSQDISAGGTASDAVVSNGGLEYVFAGGTASHTTVSSGGSAFVSSGGSATYMVVSNGGTEIVYFSGLSLNTSIGAGGYEVVSNGVASFTVAGSGGYVAVEGGALSAGVYGQGSGTTIGTIIQSGGFEIVSSGGIAENTVVQSGGTLLLLPGALVSGTVTSAGGIVIAPRVIVWSGQTVVSAVSVTLSGLVTSGTENVTVTSGGTTVSSLILNAAVETVDGGTVSSTTVSDGGYEVVSAGGTAIGTILKDNGFQGIHSGGTADGTVISQGGFAVISGGAASGTVIGSGGSESVWGGDGFLAANVTTGSAIGTVVDAGGSQTVFSGGVTTSTTVNSGGFEVVSCAATVSETIVSCGGSETVCSGGTAVSITVDAGGSEMVQPGGTTSGTVLSSGGYESLSGSGISTTIGSGAGEIVDIGGSATGTTVDSGGYLVVVPGGSATGTVNSGGAVVSTGVVIGQIGGGMTLYASSATGLTLGNNEAAFVLPGGVLISATVNSGGDVAVHAQGKASVTTVNSGGWQDVFAGGTASFTVVDGGTEFVHSGGLAISTTVNLAGSAYSYSAGVEYVYSGGIASAATINAGARQDLTRGGIAIATTVGSGGFENVSGGSTTGTVVDSGGFEIVSAGGTASGTVVDSGGSLVVFSGGAAAGAVVTAGGRLIVLPGGIATGTTGTVVSTGIVVYEPGTGGSYYPATASGVVVSSGGTEFILPGGSATDTTLISGGTIDVTTLAYVNGGSVSVDATTDMLTVIEGSSTYTQQLAGSYSGVAFGLFRDNNGEGTFITETAAASVNLAPGTTVTVGTLAAGQTIAFAGSGTPATLIFGFPAGTMSNPITGFAAGDRIEFSNGATVTAASVLNGNTLAVSYHIGSGSSLVYDFTDVTFSEGAPLTMRTSYDDVTNNYYVLPTTYMTWTGASSTDFGTASNWSYGTIAPTIADFGIFNNGVGGTITGGGTVEGINFANSGTWLLGSGTDITAVGAVAIGNAGGGTNSAGALTIGSGATIATPGGVIDVGANAGNVVTLAISGGGLLEETAADSPSSYIMNIGVAGASGSLAAASASVLVTGTGSLLDLAFNGIEIGNSGGSGSVTVSQGGSILATTQNSNDAVAVAIGPTGNGSLTVTDPGSQLTAIGGIFVGRSETGTLTVENHGTVLLDPDATGQAGIVIGSGNTAGTGGTGIATVTTGGDLISQGYVAVGLYGTTGQLNVSNSGTVQVGTSLAVGTGGTIQNGTSYAGNGTLTIGAGGTVELTGGAQTASFGVLLASSNNSQLTSSEAVVTVSGAGALLNTDGNGIAVGQFGTASLTVSQGGSVLAGTPNSNSIVALGIGKQGSGTVTVTGAGSQLTANGAAWVGRAGSGSLIIENQGSVLIGVDGMGSGGITIGGAGLSNGNTLFTGGTGTASVTTGGVLSSAQSITVGRNGDGGSLSVTGGTVVVGTGLVIGASTTLAAGGYDVVGNGMTRVATATVFNGDGTVTVGTGGLIKTGANGLGAGVAGLVIGSAAGATGDLSVRGGTVLAACGLSIFQGSTVSVSSGGGIDVGASGTISAGTIDVDSGYAITGAGLVRDAVVNNSGTIAASGEGTLELTGAVIGSGTLELNSGGTLRLDGTIGAGQSVVFGAGGPDTLILGTLQTTLANSVSGVTIGDRIEFAGLSVTGASETASGTITVSTSGGTFILNDVTFAPGLSPVLSTGTDAATGNGFVTIGTTVRAPAITGAAADQWATDTSPVNPFSGVTISDANFSQSETVTVTLSTAANGILTRLGGGSYDAATGVYTDTGTAAAVTAAVDGLIFTPITPTTSPAETVTTGFTIAVVNSAGATASDATTSVTVTIPQTATIASNGTTTLVQVGNQFLLDPAGAVAAGENGPWLEYQGSAVTAGQFGANVTPIGAVQTATGYEVAWSLGSGEYVVWNIDGNGNYTSSATGVVSGTSATVEGVEANFGEAFPNAGPIASATTIASNGTTALMQVGNLFELNPAGGGTGPLLEYQGSVVTAGQFGTNVTPIGAVRTATGYEVAWSPGSGEYVIWNTDGNGNYTSSATGVVSGTSATLEGVEANFGEAFPNAGPIASATTILSNGTTALMQVGNLFELNPAGGGTGPLLEYQGSVVTAGQFGTNVTPIGAVQTATGYEVAWSLGSGKYVVWNIDGNGNYTSSATGVVSGTSATLEGVEANFGEAFPNAGPIASATTIASNGTTALTQVGNLFELNPASGGTGPLLEYRGSVVTAGQFGPNVTPIGAAQTASGYEVAWSLGSNQYLVWNTDRNGNYTNSATGVVSGASYAWQSLEPSFGLGSGSGPTTTQIASNGETSLVQVANQYALENSSGGIVAWLTYRGSTVTAGEFGTNIAPVGAMQTATGYAVAWSLGSNEYLVWNTDSDGNYTTSSGGIVSGASYAWQNLELSFGVGSGTGPVTTQIASNGETSLVQVANQYGLENSGGGIVAWLEYQGSVATAGQFGTNVTPVGAVRTATGYEVAWSLGSGEYVVWNTDGNGNYTSSATGVVSGTSATLEGVEANFGEAFPNAGPIASATTIASNGTTALTQVGNLFELNPAGGGTGPLLEYQGSVVTAGQFGAKVTPVGAVRTATGYEVAWSLGSGKYVVWNIDGNGNYTSSATGVVSGTSATLEGVEANFGEAFPNAGTIASATTIASNGTTALTQVGNLFELNPTSGGTGPLLEYQGSVVTAGRFGTNVTPIGAMQTATGFEVAWSLGSNQYVVWNTDGNGNYTNSATGVVSGASYVWQSLEPSFGLGSGTGPVTTQIASNGETSLVQVANQYALENSSGGIVAWLEYQGSAVTAGQFGANVTPIGAVQTATGYEVAWSLGSGEYVVWNIDGNGNYTSSATGVVSGTNSTLEGVEANFGEAFPNAGPIASATTIASNGTTALTQVGNLFELLPAAGGTGPLLEYQGSVVTAGRFGTNVTPIGAVRTATGFEVAWSLGSGKYVVWNIDGNGNYTSSATGVVFGTNSTLEGMEANFGETFANAGPIASATTIASNGTTALTQVGNLFELNPAAGGTGPLLEYHGSVVTAGQFGASVTPIGAVQTATGYEVAWSLGSGKYVVWNIDGNGNYTSSATGVVSGTSATLEGVEANFGEAFPNAGTIASATTIASNGTTALTQVGNLFELNPTSGGTGPLLEYQGSVVTAGQLGPAAPLPPRNPALPGTNVTPIGAVQTATGYEVAWSLGSGEYVVWNTDSDGNYTNSPMGVVSGQSFALEDLEPVFGKDLNGDGRLSTVLVTATGTGNTLDLSAQTQDATINLGSNTARANAGLNTPGLAFIGTPDAITLGSSVDTVEYVMAPSSGIETIANFTLGVDELNIDLAGAAAGLLQAYDTTVGGLHAIAIASSADLSHGVVLLNMPSSETAAELLASHTTFSGGHVLIS